MAKQPTLPPDDPLAALAEATQQVTAAAPGGSAVVDPSYAIEQIKAANLMFQSATWMNDMVIRSRSRGQARALLLNNIVEKARTADLDTQMRILKNLDSESSEDTSLTQIALAQAAKATS